MKVGKWTIAHEEGWTGVFTRHQADGAIENGTAIVKLAGEDGDSTPEGTPGVVLGSIDGTLVNKTLMTEFNARFLYWVEWKNRPRVAFAVVDRKIARVS